MGQRLGRYIGGYRDRFFLPDKRNREIIFSYKPREGAEEKIYELISDISISMKAVDYLDMPECISNQVSVSMSESEQGLYDRMADEMILEYGEGQDIDAVNAAALSNKLQQMANGAVYDESGNVRNIHDRKLDALEDLIESANGKPLLVAYWFKHDRERILKRFPATPDHYTDTRKLFDYCFENFQALNISENDAGLAKDNGKNYGVLNNSEPYVKLDEDAYIIMPKGAQFSDVSYKKTESAKGKKKVARLAYTYAGHEVGSVDIVKTGAKVKDNYYVNILTSTSY